MIAHLWTQQPAPWEYIEFLLCRDVYHCPPDQLPDIDTIALHLMFIGVEHRLDKRTTL